VIEAAITTENDDPIEKNMAQMSQENNRARAAVMSDCGQINHIKDCLEAVLKSTQAIDPLQFSGIAVQS
jgi:hypothetical protein